MSKPAMQISPTLAERTEKALKRMFSKKELFTLLDVSNAVKKDGNDFAKHREVVAEAATITAVMLLKNPNFMTSRIDVQTPKGPDLATLFHPINRNPTDYVSIAQTAIAPITKVPIPAHHPVNTARSQKTVQARSDSYTEIPRTIWTAAKFKANNEYVADIHPSSITIYRNSLDSKYAKKILTLANKPNSIIGCVPPAGRFRLSPEMLKASRLEDCALEFCQYTDKIVVTKKV